MQPGLVTVMVPSYNYAQYLTECVESAASQQHADVVIVDNGSTDASPEIGARLAEEHDNVRFVRYERNDGIITSFNRCREEIRGEYTVLLCADDCLTPGSLARSVEFLDAHPSVGLAYGAALDFSTLADVDRAAVSRDDYTPVMYWGASWVERLCRTGLNPIRTPESIMRSSILAEVGPYEASLRYTSDLNNFLRIAARSDVAYLRGAVQGLFRQHGNNEGKAYPHASAIELTERWKAFETFFATLGDDTRRAHWEALARRRMADEARYSASRAFVRDDAGEREVADLFALAELIEPSGEGPLESAGWKLRRRLGPTGTRVFPGFQVRPFVHRLDRMRGERRTARAGLA